MALRGKDWTSEMKDAVKIAEAEYVTEELVSTVAVMLQCQKMDALSVKNYEKLKLTPLLVGSNYCVIRSGQGFCKCAKIALQHWYQ